MNINSIKKTTFILLILSFFFLLKLDLHAQQREEVGLGVEDYSKEGFFTDKTLIVEKAVKKACKNAFDNFVKNLDEDSRINYNRLKASIEKELEALVDCQNIVDELDDKEKKRYTVKVKAKIDAVGIKVLLREGSAVGQAEASGGERSIIVYHFFSRTIDSKTKKDDRVTKITTDTKTKDINQSEAIREGDIAISSETTKTNKSVTGGNVVRTSTKTTYVVTDKHSRTAESNLNAALNKAGYRLQRANATKGLEALSRKVMADYSTKDQLSDEITNQILDVLKTGKSKYYLTGIFDIGEVVVDPASGNYTVNVQITGVRVEDVTEGDSLDIETFSSKGLGSDEETAVANAITASAKKAGENLVALLNSKRKK
jgi:uncharacterized protein (DUF1330 family)